MTKMNQLRPELVLKDSIQKDIARVSALRGGWVDKPVGRFSSRVERQDALTLHETGSKIFAPTVQVAINSLMVSFQAGDAAAEDLRQARLAKKPKATIYNLISASEALREDLVLSGAKFLNVFLFQDDQVNEAPWAWLVAFLPLLDRGKARDWKVMLSLVMKENIPLALALRVANKDDEIQQWRLFFQTLDSK